MATDPKKDEFKGSEITDEQLENVAGGEKTDPTDTVMPPQRKEKTAEETP